MMKLAVFACLLVVCYAQPEPMPPDLPETFVSETAVYRRSGPGHEEERGKGKWDRSVMLKDFLSVTEYMDGNRTEMFEHLGLFETHAEYNIYTDREGKRQCEKHEIPEDTEFPVIWAWLKEAHYHKFMDRRTNRTFDAWSEFKGDESRTLLIDEAMPTKPAAMMTRSREREEDMRFVSFEATAPPASTFEVPTICNTPPPPPTASGRPQHRH